MLMHESLLLMHKNISVLISPSYWFSWLSEGVKERSVLYHQAGRCLEVKIDDPVS